MFTKNELDNELREFLLGFADSIERMFGHHCSYAMLGHPDKRDGHLDPSEIQVEGSWLWKSLMGMYDYGILGRRGESEPVDGTEYDVEMFLMGINSDAMRLYLKEDEVPWPKLAVRTMQTAIARHVLEGGDRYNDFGGDHAAAGYLSFHEVALLADMDDRSVRNAANPKLPDPLITTSVGKRSLIDVEEARRWLQSRKGFVPTAGPVPAAPADDASTIAVLMPADLMNRLSAMAGDRAVSPWELLTDLVDRQERRILDQGAGK